MLIAAVRGRHGTNGGALRVRPKEIGLDRYPELGVLLQFSAAGSRASRESLNRLARSAPTPTAGWWSSTWRRTG